MASTSPPPVNQSDSTPGQDERLLRPEEFGSARIRYRLTLRDRLNAADAKLRRAMSSRRARRIAGGSLLVLLLAGSVAAFLALRPRPVPDYLDDELEDVLDYTLVSEDFNSLPLQQRLGLLKDLVERLKGMGSGDSAMLAAFAAGLEGEAIRQARHNMEKLAADLWMDFAERYAGVSPADREAYLASAAIEMMKLVEDIAGVTRPEGEEPPSDGERWEQAQKQAKRDQEMMKKRDDGMQAADAARGFEFLQESGERLAKPEQRAQMARFARDFTRTVRGQDIDTGKPK